MSAPGSGRSEIYRWFTDPAERLRYPGHDRDWPSRAQVANLRAAYGSMAPNSQAELVRALPNASVEFAGMWERHKVAQRFADQKTLIHPELGSTAKLCLPRTSPRHCSYSLPAAD